MDSLQWKSNPIALRVANDSKENFRGSKIKSCNVNRTWERIEQNQIHEHYNSSSSRNQNQFYMAFHGRIFVRYLGPLLCLFEII